MAQDILKLGAHHCYACIQWDGTRTVEHEKKQIRADAVSEGICLVKHSKVKGNHVCELYFPIK
jgi:hypothetical protein